MYDELVKKIRHCAIDPMHCLSCGEAKDGRCFKRLMTQATDAIEELSREVEEYKAAYRKEHNKRIAENRYLYDELTKVVRAKLLMTPMRIEVPEPPKEE